MRMISVSPVMLVATGGAIGASCRYLLQQCWPSDWPAVWATLAINVLGCLAIGLTITLVQQRLSPGSAAIWLPLLTTGLLGGFTTFSAFAHEATSLFEKPTLATLYIGASVFGGLLAYQLGLSLANYFLK